MKTKRHIALVAPFNGHTPLLAARYIFNEIWGVEDNAAKRHGSVLWEFIDAISLDTKNSRARARHLCAQTMIQPLLAKILNSRCDQQIFWPHFGLDAQRNRVATIF